MAMYNDIYLRDYWDDYGNVPYAGQMVYLSPDIVPYGTSQMPNYQTTLVSTYGNNVDQGQAIQATVANYIYVRGKNLSSAQSSGSVYLYWSKSSLLLEPSTWSNQQLKIIGGGNSTPISAAAGAVAVGTTAFYWVPPAITADYHYCLIARVVTSAHSNPLPPPPPIGTMAQFVQWVQGSAAVAWRNLAYIGPGQMATRCAMDFRNPDTVSQTVFLQAVCTNLPLNSVVSFSCPLTTANFNINNVSGTINSSLQNVTGSGTLDSGAASTLFVNVQAPTGSTPLTGSVACNYWLSVPQQTTDPDMRRILQYSYHPFEVGIEDTSATPGRVVLLGNVNIQF